MKTLRILVSGQKLKSEVKCVYPFKAWLVIVGQCILLNKKRFDNNSDELHRVQRRIRRLRKEIRYTHNSHLYRQTKQISKKTKEDRASKIHRG